LVWGPIALRAEAAKSTGDPLGGISADLWKYYDLISPEIALGFLESLGLSSRVALPLKAFYRDLFRFMSLNGVTAPGFRSSQAVLQGCAWSNPLAFAIAFAWASRVEETAAVWAYFYADDWYLLCDRYSLGQRRTPSSRAGPPERQEQPPPCPPVPPAALQRMQAWEELQGEERRHLPDPRPAIAPPEGGDCCSDEDGRSGGATAAGATTQQQQERRGQSSPRGTGRRRRAPAAWNAPDFPGRTPVSQVSWLD
jgi:hypothetical protein